MNLERMKQLECILTFLEGDMPLRRDFNMDYWRAEMPHCGTTYCWAGLYVQKYQNQPDSELYFSPTKSHCGEFKILSRKGKFFNTIDVLSDHFDITIKAAKYLFILDGTYNPANATSDLKELRHRFKKVSCNEGYI